MSFDTLATTVAATSDSQEVEDRQNLDNVVDFSKAAYSDTSDVMHASFEGRFSQQALNTRRLLEGRLKLIRDRLKPIKDEEKEAKKELERFDKLIIDAWDLGARTSDDSLKVETTKPRRSWSETVVEACCEHVGIDFDRFARRASDFWKSGRKVKQYK